MILNQSSPLNFKTSNIMQQNIKNLSFFKEKKKILIMENHVCVKVKQFLSFDFHLIKKKMHTHYIIL